MEQVAISFSRGSSQARDETHDSGDSSLGRQVLYHQRPLGSRDCEGWALFSPGGGPLGLLDSVSGPAGVSACLAFQGRRPQAWSTVLGRGSARACGEGHPPSARGSSGATVGEAHGLRATSYSDSKRPGPLGRLGPVPSTCPLGACPATPLRGQVQARPCGECPPPRPRPAGPPVPSGAWVAGMARAAGPERRLLAVYTGGTIGMRSERGGEWGGRPARGGGRGGGRAPAGRHLTRPDPRSGGHPAPPPRCRRLLSARAWGASLLLDPVPAQMGWWAGVQELSGPLTPDTGGCRATPATPCCPWPARRLWAVLTGTRRPGGDLAVEFPLPCPGALTGFGSGRGDCWAGEGLSRGAPGPHDPGAGVPPGRAEHPGSLQGWAGHRTHPWSVVAWPPRGPWVLAVGVLALQEGPRQPFSLSLEPCPALWSGGAGPLPPTSRGPPPQPSAAPCAPRSPAGLTPGAAPPCPGVSSYLELSQLPRALPFPQNQLCPATTPRANRASSTPPTPATTQFP